MSDTTFLHIFFRSHEDSEFIHSKIEIPMHECDIYETMTTNDLMEVAVRHEFETEGGAYHMHEPDPEWTAKHQIDANLENSYDLIAAFFGDVHFIQ
jgi:hypothetical protein